MSNKIIPLDLVLFLCIFQKRFILWIVLLEVLWWPYNGWILVVDAFFTRRNSYLRIHSFFIIILYKWVFSWILQIRYCTLLYKSIFSKKTNIQNILLKKGNFIVIGASSPSSPPPILLCILWTKYMSWPLYPTWPKIHQSRNSSNVDSPHSPFNSWYSTTSKAFCFYLDANLCSLSPCHSNASCKYAQGSVNCTCQTGFQGNGFTCSGKLASML